MLKELREKLKWLDPFTYVDEFLMPRINPSNNQAIAWVVYIFFAFVFAWLIYSALGFLLGTSVPIVVVVSPSMEPTYYRGDAIVITRALPENLVAEEVFLEKQSLKETPFSEIGRIVFGNNSSKRLEAESITFLNGETIPVSKQGSIVVYFSKLRNQPIIHRAIAKIRALDGVYVLTKGDSINNNTIDQDCGSIASGFPEKNCLSIFPVPISELDGKALFRIPMIGCVKLWALDNTISIIQTGRLPQHFNGVC